MVGNFTVITCNFLVITIHYINVIMTATAKFNIASITKIGMIKLSIISTVEP